MRGKLPADDLGAGEAHVSAIVHWIPSPWPRSVIPGLEATLTLPFESGVDETATVIPQLYIGLNRGGHVALSVGVELPLTDEEYDYRARAFLLWDFADGPIWAGW